MITSAQSTLLVDCSLIDDSNRIRQDYTHVESLAQSISDHGQLQPVVLTADYKLIAGGSRLRAVRDVLKLPQIAAVFMETLSEDRLRMLEVEENIRRKDFTWQERILGVARVHELKWREGILSGAAERWTQRQTGELLNISVGNVNSCLLLTNLIRSGDKDILAASSVTDALKILLLRKENEANKLLAAATFKQVKKPSIASVTANSDSDFFTTAAPKPSAPLLGGVGIALPSDDEAPPTIGIDVAPLPVIATPVDIPLSQMLHHGDSITWMESHLESVNHIITDIPYGIEMSNLQQSTSGMDVSSTAEEHDVDANISLMRRLLPAAYGCLKPGGFMVFWYDLDHHGYLQDLAEQAGFVVQRWPLVWVKTHGCLNQSAQYNFTKATETAMVLRKGNAVLISPQPTNYFIGGNEDAKQRFNHPFAKPTKLWQWVAKAVAIQGHTILDPFAGVGSGVVSFLEAGYSVVAAEINEDHYNRLVINVSNHYRAVFPNAQFH